MNGERFSINGIAVTARSLGNGLFIGIPDNLMEALGALLSGKLFEPRTIVRLTEPTPEPKYQKPRPYSLPKISSGTIHSSSVTQDGPSRGDCTIFERTIVINSPLGSLSP